MARKRIFLVLLSLLAYGAAIFLVYLWVMPPLSHVSRLAEEQEIYSIVIGNDNLLTDTTELGWLDTKEYGDYIEKGLPDLEEETLKDYQEVNNREYDIKEYLPVGKPYILLSNSEIEQIYQAGSTSFHNKYPNEHGIVSFSRIGFNARFTQALLLKGYGSPAEGENEGGYSEGTFILLEKKHGLWTVVAELTAWVS